MTASIVALDSYDVRFPTSRQLDGSDAMHPDPDYSAAYVVVRTDAADGHRGDGFAFTIGRGNEVQTAAIRALAPFVVGRPLDATMADLGGLWKELVHDLQLRWLGPEKGVMHMAISAVVNALWDLRAEGYPAYATSPGWLGYDDDKLRRLCKQALADGFTQIKLKVGHDLRRLRVAREVCGPGIRIAVDANQRWDVGTAIAWIRELAPYQLWWVEEPTSPDDVLGHATIARAIAPIPVATGEHVQNRVVFKQLLQLGAISYLQLDAARVAGVNENVAIVLLAAKFGVPACPHAGGVGLCELVQHLSMFDYVAVSGSMEDRVIEYVDHLHEHFIDPVVIRGGRYRAPLAPGFSATMRPETLVAYACPDGPVWLAEGRRP